jgi:hypothetical protein
VAKKLQPEPGVVRFRFADDPRSDEVSALVTYNRVLLSEQSLLVLLEAFRDGTAPPEAVGRAGKQITIPPDLP